MLLNRALSSPPLASVPKLTPPQGQLVPAVPPSRFAPQRPHLSAATGSSSFAGPVSPLPTLHEHETSRGPIPLRSISRGSAAEVEVRMI